PRGAADAARPAAEDRMARVRAAHRRQALPEGRRRARRDGRHRRGVDRTRRRRAPRAPGKEELGLSPRRATGYFWRISAPGPAAPQILRSHSRGTRRSPAYPSTMRSGSVLTVTTLPDLVHVPAMR